MMAFNNTLPEINEEKIIIDDNKIELAPNIIHLDDTEKFRDDKGERKVDGIYFKVKDIMTGFKMDNLLTTIIDKRKDGYFEEIHYKYFNCNKIVKAQNKTIKIKKELFLTYEGLLRDIIINLFWIIT